MENLILVHSADIYHHGVKGQKWGKRQYQYEDGSLTPLGREHYGIKERIRGISKREYSQYFKNGKLTSEGKKYYKNKMTAHDDEVNYELDKSSQRFNKKTVKNAIGAGIGIGAAVSALGKPHSVKNALSSAASVAMLVTGAKVGMDLFRAGIHSDKAMRAFQQSAKIDNILNKYGDEKATNMIEYGEQLSARAEELKKSK